MGGQKITPKSRTTLILDRLASKKKIGQTITDGLKLEIMYYPNCPEYEYNVEEICYHQGHIDKVWKEIKQVIPAYFQQYIQTENGHSVQDSEAQKLVEKFGSTAIGCKK